jgi:hypothetical protein
MSTTNLPHRPLVNDARLATRVPKSMLEAMRDVAKRNERPLTSEVRRAIRAHLEREHADEQGA